MCIGIPMRILASDGMMATCEGRGVRAEVNMMLVEDPPPGSWVLVHLGSAVRELDHDEAAQINDGLDALDAVLRGESLDGFFADLTAADLPSGLARVERLP